MERWALLQPFAAPHLSRAALVHSLTASCSQSTRRRDWRPTRAARRTRPRSTRAQIGSGLTTPSRNQQLNSPPSPPPPSTMRAALLLCVLAVSLALAAALPNANVCNEQQVQLELRPSAQGMYQLSFVAVDPRAAQNKADFVDIHYRSATARAQRSSEAAGERRVIGLKSDSPSSLVVLFLQHQQRGQREPARADRGCDDPQQRARQASRGRRNQTRRR